LGRDQGAGKALADNHWELTLTRPLTDLGKGTLTVSVKDKQNNVSRVPRTFSVVSTPRP
jgi:hypothetical protein